MKDYGRDASCCAPSLPPGPLPCKTPRRRYDRCPPCRDTCLVGKAIKIVLNRARVGAFSRWCLAVGLKPVYSCSGLIRGHLALPVPVRSLLRSCPLAARFLSARCDCMSAWSLVYAMLRLHGGCSWFVGECGLVPALVARSALPVRLLQIACPLGPRFM